MSNFICSECGMTNIDCGSAGYKTPKEIELEKKLDIAVKALEEISKCYSPEYNKAGEISHKALKKIEELK